MSDDNQEQKEKLLAIVRKALERDADLRKELQIGDKFRFIRDRLTALMSRVEKDLSTLKKEEKQFDAPIAEDEVLVYIYLYNAQGVAIQTWQKMLNPSVFYEYSINRPIYADQKELDAFIRTKANKNQHAYITIAVKKNDIMSQPEQLIVKDPIGNALIRVKEGAFHSNRMRAFTHNSNVYRQNEDGLLIKKESSGDVLN